MIYLHNSVITFIRAWRWFGLTTLSSLLFRSEDDGAGHHCHLLYYGLKMMALDNTVIIFTAVWRLWSLMPLSSLLVRSGDDVAWHCHPFYFGLKIMWIDNAVIQFTAAWRCWSLTPLSSILVRPADDAVSKQQSSLLAGCSSSIGMHILRSLERVFRLSWNVEHKRLFRCLVTVNL
jgi:hypothetical protein